MPCSNIGSSSSRLSFCLQTFVPRVDPDVGPHSRRGCLTGPEGGFSPGRRGGYTALVCTRFVPCRAAIGPTEDASVVHSDDFVVEITVGRKSFDTVAAAARSSLLLLWPSVRVVARKVQHTCDRQREIII